MLESKIDMVRLKSFANSRLKGNQVLQKLILNERDEIPVEEFLIKVKIWLNIIG
jgi:hypothetical protein